MTSQTGTSSRMVDSPVDDRSHEYGLVNEAFVGSPQQMGGFDDRMRRPELGTQRRHSSTMVSKQPSVWETPRRSRMTRLPAGNHAHEHQWSVFEQLMQNEGQMRPSTTPRTRGRNQGRSLVDSREGDGGAAFNSFGGRNVQSPDHDPFLSTPASTHQPSAPVDVDPNSEVSSEHDSDSELDTDETPMQSPSIVEGNKSSRWRISLKIPVLPTLYKNILKCSLAYFLGSLFTFSPYLSGFLSDISSYGAGERGPSPSGHMVATIAVYFNPAKTIGGMVEADSYCFMALFYSAFVCLCSMSTFWWLEVKPGWEWMADLLVLLWVGISMSAVSWMKVWMAKPTFNTACSMAAIILFVVIVKEGGFETLLQVSFVVLTGATVSNTVCLLIWPQKATTSLQDNMTKTLDSFSTLLQMLTNSFLLEEPLRKLSQEKMQKAIENHQSSFTSLTRNLSEAYSEWFNGFMKRGKKGSGKAYQDAIDSLNRLGQHLNGLRSGTRLQYEITKAQSTGKLKSKLSGTFRKSQYGADELEFLKTSHGDKGKMQERDRNVDEASDEVLLQAAADKFGELVDDLGPPLKSLSGVCVSSLKRLREAFAYTNGMSRKGSIHPEEFHEIIDGIERALFTFESTSNHAVMRLYRRSDISGATSRASVNSVMDDSQMAIKTDTDHVFLVYFFIFTLQEFAKELVSLVDAMRRVYGVEHTRLTRASWWRRNILSIPHTFYSGLKSLKTSPPEKRRRPGLQHRISAYMKPPQNRIEVAFPKVRPHAPNTIQTPRPSNFIGRIQLFLWELGARLREPDLRYAFKAGMATAMLAAPAFFDATRPVFVEYRGEWALVSFFAVISPTIGATNFLGIHRVLGTIFGAGVAAGVYTAFPDNAIVLSLFGFFFSIPCFYYIVAKPEYAATGRFVLLTYNLTCLYCYNLRDKDISVFHIAYHRSTAVTAGVIWAAFISRLWWPAEARRELSKALGEFCLNLGWLYTRLVASYSETSEPVHDNAQSSDDEHSPALRTATLSTSVQEFMAMELHLQIKLLEMQGLLAQTQHEPRLKGPFPVLMYRSILTSLQSILDKLHSMRCVTTRTEWLTSVRRDFIFPVNKERHEMVGNIILYFSTLASAFRLKAPLPPYLPPAEKSRQRLVEAIRRLDVVKNRDVQGSRQLLFFAYALTMRGVTQELETLGRTLQNAFGVIGHTPEEFEALFMEATSFVDQNV